jgi:23S rRNA pseudouridine2605 synthase
MRRRNESGAGKNRSVPRGGRSGPARRNASAKPSGKRSDSHRSDDAPANRRSFPKGNSRRYESDKPKFARGAKNDFGPSKSARDPKKPSKKPFATKTGGPASAPARRGRFTTGKTRELPSDAKPSGPSGRPRTKSAFFGKPYKKSYKAQEGREGGGVSQRRVRKIAEEESTAPKSDKIRLNKFIANSGVSSRREADEFISMGLISVNGKVITELGYKVNPGDEVRYENKVLRAEKPVYILMNKPKGFLTTTDDPQERKTVMHLLGAGVKERIYPVGRLDRNTTGLLLLTNDGDLADKLMHPSFNVKKIYKVELDKPITKGDFQAIAEGVRLDEGRATVDDVAIVSDDKRTVGIELHIGWNRVVRRIFESLGYEVLKLDRTAYAGLDKKDLGRGEWRFLTKEEIIHLKHFK